MKVGSITESGQASFSEEITIFLKSARMDTGNDGLFLLAYN